MSEWNRRTTWTGTFLAALLAVAGGIALAGEAAPPAPGAKPANASTDWPQWRGPNRDGAVVGGPKLLDAWPKEGPKLLWKSGPIPSAEGGWSSCVVAAGKVYAYYTAKVPKDGAKGLVPVTAELLNEWGWIEDAPPELLQKIEEARKSDAWRALAGDRSGSRKVTVEETDAFAKQFMAGLDAKVAEKYADFIKKRFRRIEGLGSPTWAALRGLAKIKDKEFKDSRDFSLHAGLGEGAPGGVFDRLLKWTDVLVCLDARTGKELWRKSLLSNARQPRDSYDFGFGGSSTPAVADGKCYVAGLFGLYCLAAADGAVVWQKPLERDNGSSGCSPLVWRGVLYCCPFSLPLSAYEAQTGRLLWTQPAVGGQSFPVLWTHEGTTRLIFSGNGGSGTFCVDPADGKVLWKVKYGSWSTPTVAGDYLLVGAGKRRAYKMTPTGADLLWEETSAEGELYIGSSLVYQGCVYTANGGRCLDLKTGEVKWTASKGGMAYCYCTPCAADGKVFGYTHPQEGNDFIQMFRASPEKYELLGEFRPRSDQKENFAHIIDLNYVTSPTIADGRLYVRMSDCVYCYDLTAGAAE